MVVELIGDVFDLLLRSNH